MLNGLRNAHCLLDTTATSSPRFDGISDQKRMKGKHLQSYRDLRGSGRKKECRIRASHDLIDATKSDQRTGTLRGDAGWCWSAVMWWSIERRMVRLCSVGNCVMVWPTFNGTGWNSAELGFLVLYFLVSKECRFPWRNCSSRKLSENEWSRQGAWHDRYLHTRANWINWFASGSGQSLLAVDRGGQLAIVQNTWRTDGWMDDVCSSVRPKSSQVG